ncbi:MAG TPA: DUF488 domain-containing protein [Candidatus Saccharimonadaceae bacterium]|nr:DUF488 domain-containing protein [Candidatus Saccharimonadaceae bacterium]
MTGPLVYTIGHSTRSTREFLAILRAHHVEQVVDVRRWPRSQRHPHFSAEALAASLAGAGIAYVHREGLGGMRRPHSDSLNAGWREAAFRGYADYMQSPAFARELEAVTLLAARARTALMCAEARPESCHRQLIADALIVRGVGVDHLEGVGPPRPHVLTRFARVERDRLIYPPEAPLIPGL